jgi:hypothetical protein
MNYPPYPLRVILYQSEQVRGEPGPRRVNVFKLYQQWDLTGFPFIWHWGHLPRVKRSGRESKKSSPLASRLRMNGAIPLLPAYAITALTGIDSAIRI